MLSVSGFMRISVPAIFLLAFFAVTQGVWGQETGPQFNLSTPGARSLAMGGAFLALADDATAAYTNPAGLTNLAIGGSEVAVEMRSWRYSNLFLERGHLDGNPTNIGIDTVSGFKVDEAVSRVSGLSFLSVGYVLPRGATIALYRHELARWGTDQVRQGFFSFAQDEFPDDCGKGGELCRDLPMHEVIDVGIVNYGIAGAHELRWPTSNGERSLSLGVGVSYYQMDLSSRADLFGFDSPVDQEGNRLDEAVLRRPRGFFGPTDLLEDSIIGTRIIDDTDSALGYSLGFLWKRCGERKPGKDQCWNIGGVYRRGPEFRYHSHSVSGPVLGSIPGGQGQGGLRVPDIYGIGVAYSAAEGKTKLSLDYQRVLYSQRFHDSVPRGSSTASELSLKDSDEPHLGVEHVFLSLGAKLVGTLRAGVWHEPYHEIQGTSSEAKLFFAPGKGQIHWTGGIGFVIKEEFQIDAAADFSERATTVSIALVKFL